MTAQLEFGGVIKQCVEVQTKQESDAIDVRDINKMGWDLQMRSDYAARTQKIPPEERDLHDFFILTALASHHEIDARYVRLTTEVEHMLKAHGPIQASETAPFHTWAQIFGVSLGDRYLQTRHQAAKFTSMGFKLLSLSKCALSNELISQHTHMKHQTFVRTAAADVDEIRDVAFALIENLELINQNY